MNYRGGWKGASYPEDLDDGAEAIEGEFDDPSSAAEALAEQKWHAWDLWEAGDSLELGVISPEGERFSVEVSVDSEPVFSAAKSKRIGGES